MKNYISSGLSVIGFSIIWANSTFWVAFGMFLFCWGVLLQSSISVDTKLKTFRIKHIYKDH